MVATSRRIRSVGWILPVALAGCKGLGPEDVARFAVLGRVVEAAVGSTVTNLQQVEAVTADGRPVPGVAISYEVVAGGGTISPTDSRTGEDGRSRPDQWTLGPLVGENFVRATLIGTEHSALLHIDASPGAPARIEGVSGDGQTEVAGLVLPEPLVARVTDRFGNPVSGVEVAWIAADRGEVSRSRTDSLGAVRTSWKLAPAPGVNTVTATTIPDGFAFAYTVTGVPGAVVFVRIAGEGQTAVVGEVLPVDPVFELRDAQGNPVPGEQMRFSTYGGTPSPMSAVTDADGRVTASWTLDTTPGLQLLFARTDRVTGSISATAVVGPPAKINVQRGAVQYAEVGLSVPVSPIVQVVDLYDNPLSATQVIFLVTGGGGTIFRTLVRTDTLGLASPGAWTMGPSPGTNTLLVTAGDAQITIEATALAAAFGIDVDNLWGEGTPLTPALRFATDRWRWTVIGDLPDVSFAANPIPADACGIPHPEINDTVDDLRILVFADGLDGPGGVGAVAGPCVVRDSTLLPIIGVVIVDVADIMGLDGVGILDDLVTHEFGHVLGFGTIWDSLGLLADPSLAADSTVDTHFVGPKAVAAFDSIGGVGYRGSKVPVENEVGGAGTLDAHWRENVFTRELMSGIINVTHNPVSAVTIGSLADLGYVVNPASAEHLALTYAPIVSGDLRAAPDRVAIGRDILRIPIRIVRPNGRRVNGRSR